MDNIRHINWDINWDIYQLCHGDVFLGYILGYIGIYWDILGYIGIYWDMIYWDKNIGIFHEYGGYRRMQWGNENDGGHGE